MRGDIIVSCILLLLLLLYIKYNRQELFLDKRQVLFNYPSRMTRVIKEFRLGYSPSVLYPRNLIPKDLRCDPILDCHQKITYEDGKEVIIPPIRTKCLGDRKAICRPIKGVKSYPLNPSK